MTGSEYARTVLTLFRELPGTTARVGPADRRIALSLHERGMPLEIVRAALLLATARRLLKAVSPPQPVRSLAYYLAVIDELAAEPPDPSYIRFAEHRLRQRYPMPAPSSPDSRTPEIQKHAVP